jgi:hypothetical protein
MWCVAIRSRFALKPADPVEGLDRHCVRLGGGWERVFDRNARHAVRGIQTCVKEVASNRGDPRYICAYRKLFKHPTTDALISFFTPISEFEGRTNLLQSLALSTA